MECLYAEIVLQLLLECLVYDDDHTTLNQQQMQSNESIMRMCESLGIIGIQLSVRNSFYILEFGCWVFQSKAFQESRARRRPPPSATTAPITYMLPVGPYIQADQSAVVSAVMYHGTSKAEKNSHRQSTAAAKQSSWRFARIGRGGPQRYEKSVLSY